MATFLELVQETERESGTMPSVPSTTTGATGRHANFVRWVRDAYTRLQRERGDWLWMRDRFQGDLSDGRQSYDAGSLGIATRFRDWVSTPLWDRLFTLSSPGTREDEQGLLLISWQQMTSHYQFGAQASERGRPIYVAIAPDRQLHFHPTPDGEYTLRGWYVRGAQVLASDGDVPEMPEDYHDAIKWAALLSMATFDEAFTQVAPWSRELELLRQGLLRSQTPRLAMAGPLA